MEDGAGVDGIDDGDAPVILAYVVIIESVCPVSDKGSSRRNGDCAN